MNSPIQAGASSRGAPTRGVLLALGLCIFAAGLLRLVGLDYALPEFFGHDERVFLVETEHFRSGFEPEPDEQWVLTAYPHLLPRLCALLPAPSAPRSPALADALAAAVAPWVELRGFLALLSLSIVPLTWWLARRWMSDLGALVAAGLMATSLFHVTLSIQQKPHALAASLDLLALIAALELVRKPTLVRCLCAGGAAALALGALHSAVLCLPPLGLALWLGRGRAAAGPARRAALALLPLAASFALFYPFFLHQVQAGTGGGPRGAGLAGFASFLAQNLHGARVAKLATSVFELDPLLVGLALAGLLLLALELARRRGLGGFPRGEALVLLAFVLPYLLLLALYRDTLVRFLLPLTPLLACAAGWFVERVARTLAARGGSASARAAALGALALPLGLSAWPAAQFAWARTRPSPMGQAAHWIEQHVDPAERIALLPYRDLPLAYSRPCASINAEVPHRSPWSEWLLAHPDACAGETRWNVLVEPGGRPDSRLEFQRDPLRYFRTFGVRWVVLDVSGGAAEGVLGPVATRVARFTSSRDDDGAERGVTLVGTGYDPLRPSAARLLDSTSFGTTIEIWRLD